MANIAISDLNTEAAEVNDNDLFLVSKKGNGDTFTSAKVKASVVRESMGSGSGVSSCSFTESKVKDACQQALTTATTTNAIKNACGSALSESSSIQQTISEAFANALDATTIQNAFNAAIQDINIGDIIANSIQDVLINNTNIIENQIQNNIKGRFVDYSNVVTLATNQKLNSTAFPFDALFRWAGNPGLTINGTNVLGVPSIIAVGDNASYYEAYVEAGSEVYKTRTDAALTIIPLSYGSTILDMKNYTLLDFCTDSAKYSELSEIFSTIELRAGTSTSGYTVITTQNAATATNYPYWRINLVPRNSIIYTGGGKLQQNKLFSSDYYLSGKYLSKTAFYSNNNMNYTGNLAKKMIIPQNYFLSAFFSARVGGSTTLATKPVSFFDGIQIGVLENFEIV